MESYTDVLNRLFPWGCETESEVIEELTERVTQVAETARRVTDLQCGIEKLRDRLSTDTLALAFRIEELAQRVEKLERLLEKED